MHQNLDFRQEYLSKLRDGETITVLGEIYKEEQLDETTCRIYLKDCYVSIQNSSIQNSAFADDTSVISVSVSENVNSTYIPCNNVMVYTSSANFQAGIILKIKGQFHNFREASNEGNFHSRLFYHSQKIDFYLEAEEVEIKDSNLSLVEKKILDLKESLSRVYQSSLPKKWAGVIEGIVLGDKSSLDEGLKNLFTISGIEHILTVSGLHVSVLGKGFYKILRNRRLGFFLSGIMAGILLLGYGYLTGNGVSTMRAIGMMLLFMVAQWIGRSYDMLNSLGGVCLFLLWENPFLIDYTGLWFSVMALIGVGWIGNVLSENVGKGKALWMSVGVTLATLPIVAYCYYELPLYSPILNCIVIPLLTPVFVCGVFGGVIGLFLPGVGKVILYPCRLILSLYEWVCEWIGKLPFANIITGEPPIWLMVMYYVLLGLGVLWVKRKKLCSGWHIRQPPSKIKTESDS
jgi:competence protein ComEC